MKKLFSLLLALLTVASLAVPAFAATTDRDAGPGSVNLQKSRKVTITPDVNPYTPSDLFGNFKGVMPGDKLDEVVKIKNWAVQYDYVKVYMEAKQHPLEELVIDGLGVTVEENFDFLSKLKLTVKNGDKTIYEAAPGTAVELDEEGGLKEPVYLGKLGRLASMDLKVHLEVPIELNNDYANAIGEVDWVFYFEGFNNPKDNPKTGDYIIMGAVALMAVSGLALVILFVTKRRKNRK